MMYLADLALTEYLGCSVATELHCLTLSSRLHKHRMSKFAYNHPTQQRPYLAINNIQLCLLIGRDRTVSIVL
jgi:hypothetical protein